MRAEGYYWIRSNAFVNSEHWAIAEWHGNYFTCDHRSLTNNEIIEVDERQVTRLTNSEKIIETGMLQHNGETRKSEVEVAAEISESFKNQISTTFGESANSFVKE